MTSDRTGRGDRAAAAAQVVADRLRADLDVVVEEILHRLRAEVPEYARVSTEGAVADDLVETISRLAEAFLDLLVAGRRLSSDERVSIVGTGLRRARDGFSHRGVSDAVHLALSVARRHVLVACDAARIGDDARHEMLDALSDFEFDVIRAFQDGFARFEEEESEDRRRARESFLRQIVEHGVADATLAVERAEALGFALAPPLTVVVLVDEDPAEPAREALAGAGTLIDRATQCVRELDVMALGPVPEPDDGRLEFAVALFPPPDPRRPDDDPVARLPAACARQGLVAVTAVAEDLDQLRPTVRCLQATVPILPRLVKTLGRVVTPDAVRPWRLVSALWPEEQEERLQALIGPLMGNLTARSDSAERHVQTLDVYIDADCNAAEAARRLNYSETAVRARIETVERLTGREVREHRTDFWIVLRLLELWEGELPPPGDTWWTRGAERSVPDTGERGTPFR